MNERLFERIYRLSEVIYNSRKLYYHISPNQFSTFERRNTYRKEDKEQGGTFLSPSPKMIAGYSEYLKDHFKQDYFYLYRCMVSNDLNIFNPSVRQDREAFIEHVKLNSKQFIRQYVSHTFAFYGHTLKDILDDLFTRNAWQNMENPAVARVVKELGFDGLESTEEHVVNILVFNPTKIRIVDGAPWKQIRAQQYRFIMEDFAKIFGKDALETKHRERSDISVASDLESYTIPSVFKIETFHKDGEPSEQLDFSEVFTKRGEVDESELRQLLNDALIGQGGIWAKYEGNDYKTVDKLVNQLGKEYGFGENEWKSGGQDHPE
jgi:hypothetical protein